MKYSLLLSGMKTQQVTLIEILENNVNNFNSYEVRMLIQPKGLNSFVISSNMTNKEIWHMFDVHPDDLQSYRIELEHSYNKYCNA